MDFDFVDHYAVLGLEGLASTAKDIKKAYRALARKLHPDKNPDDKDAASKFDKVQQSYAILSDQEKRIEYDKEAKAQFLRRDEELKQTAARRAMKSELLAKEEISRKRKRAEMGAKAAEDHRKSAIRRLREEGAARAEALARDRQTKWDAARSKAEDEVDFERRGREGRCQQQQIQFPHLGLWSRLVGARKGGHQLRF